MSRCLIVSAMLFLATLPLSCCRTPHRQVETTKEIPNVTWDSNYVSKGEAVPKLGDIPLVRFYYSDVVTMGIVREHLDRNGVQYHLFSEHGCNILV